jgi:hypothetical protein
VIPGVRSRRRRPQPKMCSSTSGASAAARRGSCRRSARSRTGKLVEARVPQETAEPGDPRVVLEQQPDRCALWSASSSPRFSASATIVRNLSIRKRRPPARSAPGRRRPAPAS